MHICLEYQSVFHEKVNSACLKKATIRLMFEALKMCIVSPESSLLD